MGRDGCIAVVSRDKLFKQESEFLVAVFQLWQHQSPTMTISETPNAKNLSWSHILRG